MHRRLGEILVAEGVVDAHQLKAALATAARHGRRVGEVLIDTGACSEAEIVVALSAQLGIPVARVRTAPSPGPEVLALIPADLAIDRLVLPLSLDTETGKVELVLADPTDQDLIDELRFRTGYSIQPLVGVASDVADAIGRFYTAELGADADDADSPRTLTAEEAMEELQDRIEALEANLDRAYTLLEAERAARTLLATMLDERGVLPATDYALRLRHLT